VSLRAVLLLTDHSSDTTSPTASATVRMSFVITSLSTDNHSRRKNQLPPPKHLVRKRWGKTSIYIAHLVDQPPLMRSLVTNGSRPTTQATAHSLHTQAWAATRPLARQHQSAVRLHLRNPSLMDYYSFNRPRRDGRLTDSGRFTHKVVTRPAVSLAQDRESTPAGPVI